MLNLSPATLISRIITLLIAFTVHEFAHAWTAHFFGDNTAKDSGRLTLNPMAHLDPVGTLMLIMAGFGWAKPVPVNPYVLNMRSRSALMWVSLAGPFSNFMLALMAAIPIRAGLISLSGLFQNSSFLPSPSSFLIEFIWINLALTFFNLIPLAPLDGEKIADYFLPPSWSRIFDQIRPYGPIILLAILFVGPWIGLDIFRWILVPAINSVMKLMIGV
jgi:Zn-dependent protease